MQNHALKLDAPQQDPLRVGQVALKGFFKITSEWGLSGTEQSCLLGSLPKSTFIKYKGLPSVRLSHDMLERISYVMGIYKALRIIFPTHEQANAWPKKPNEAMPFNGKSALEYLVHGGRVVDLADVRRYLDAQRG